ncbi:MAG: hypothetical protein NVS2B2_37600 [Ktedonobacteraceae bacterium]
MVKRILTLRELNLATLARQLLLERVSLPALDAFEHLVGLQAYASIFNLLQAYATTSSCWTLLENCSL